MLPVPALQRQAVSEGDPLMARMKEVLGRFDRLERILTSPAAAGGGGQTPVARTTPINWSELEALVRLHQVDREAARRSTTLLTPAEVVAKFGIPPEVGAGNGGVFFNYPRTQPNGTKGRVSFTFVDGYVVFHEIHPDR